MSILAITALVLSLAPQEPAAQSGVLLVPGTIEATEQPSRASRSRFRRTPRVNVPGAIDDLGRIDAKLRSLVGVRGLEENQVTGFGLVTGLSGTGDSGSLATQLMSNTLLTQRISIDPALLTTAN